MTRPDASQEGIVDALRQVGAAVWVIGQPADLLVNYHRKWFVLEAKPAPEPGKRVKTLSLRKRKDQDKQTEFLSTYAVPIVRTAQEAIEAVTQGVTDGRRSLSS